MPDIDTDVIIVGAAPTGLMLAGELRLTGVRTIVLERMTAPGTVKKAGGLGGQILDLLRHRGLLERFEAASGQPRPAPRFPFGGLHVDLTELADDPMQALLLPQPRMESLLEDIADERGADIRRGHELTGLTQDDAEVTAQVRGPDGGYRITARFLVGCDGVGSRVRDMAGIGFPGLTYPDVHRLGSFAMPEAVTLLDDGDYEIAGLGRVRAGYTQTERGIFAISSYTPDDLGLYTSEEDATSYADDQPLTLAEFDDSIRRVLGVSIPLQKPTRLTRFTYGARQADRYRAGRVMVAGDAAHRFPSGGVAVNAGMMDAVNLAWKLAAEVDDWAPDGLLDSYHVERHCAGARTLMHTQAQVALRRGLDPAADALREIVAELLLDDQPRRRIGALIAGTDIRYPMAGTHQHPLTGTFARDLGVDLHGARPVLVDLADRADLRGIAREWLPRIDIRATHADDRAADARMPTSPGPRRPTSPPTRRDPRYGKRSRTGSARRDEYRPSNRSTRQGEDPTRCEETRMTTSALPPVVDKDSWRAALDELRTREKAATRELDAIAAQRRRLPMVEMPEYTLIGADGPTRLVDVFDGRDQLIVYNHMWFDDAEWQCGGCTGFTSQFTRLEFLANYDARFVVVTNGPIAEALQYKAKVGNKMDWYSSSESSFGADVGAAPGTGFAVNVFLRDGETVYRTWHTDGRGTEQLSHSFALIDLLPWGRQEVWQDSPEGWPQAPTYSKWADSPDIAKLYGPDQR